MKQARSLLCVCLLLSLAAWSQGEPSKAPKSRKAHTAGVHKMAPHAARQLSLREQEEQARMSTEQRRQAKLAKKQRKEAIKRSRRTRKSALKNQ